MVTAEAFNAMIMELGDVTAAPHFEKTAFKANNKIFSSLSADGRACHIKLSLVDQSTYCAFDNKVIFPVPNKWGLQGWTTINLTAVRKTTLRDALKSAYTLGMQSKKKKG